MCRPWALIHSFGRVVCQQDRVVQSRISAAVGHFYRSFDCSLLERSNVLLLFACIGRSSGEETDLGSFLAEEVLGCHPVLH